MAVHGPPPEDFGQQQSHTCGLACVRYLLTFHGISQTETELWDLLGKPAEDGCTFAEMAKLLHEHFKLTPVIRALQGKAHLLAGDVPTAWVGEGNAGELEHWLQELVGDGRPVMVALDMAKLSKPRGRLSNKHHAIVVTDVTEREVCYLEPSPVASAAPQQGALMTAPRKHFLAAWKAIRFIALAVQEQADEQPA